MFPGSCILGMHSTTTPNKQRYCGQLQNHVRIANFSGRNRKASILWESAYFFVVLWYGGSCQEMCGAILWVSKEDHSTTLQSIYFMIWWPSFQRIRNEIRGTLVTSLLSNGSKMLKIDKDWKAWYSMVFVRVCGLYKNWLGRNKALTQCGKERSRFGRANISRSRSFGLHSTRMRNEQRYCGKLQKCVWI